MNKRVTIQFADFIKSRLAGGLLCCLVLLAAYLFQMFFPGMYVDASNIRGRRSVSVLLILQTDPENTRVDMTGLWSGFLRQ